MLLIVIVALVAITAFYRQAKRAGVPPGRAASVPFFAAGAVTAIAYLASWGIAKSGVAEGLSDFAMNTVGFMLQTFLLLAYLTLIRRNWEALVQASATNEGQRD